jgi:hypothetical protein
VIDRGSRPSPRGCSASATPHVMMQTHARIAHSVEVSFGWPIASKTLKLSSRKLPEYGKGLPGRYIAFWLQYHMLAASVPGSASAHERRACWCGSFHWVTGIWSAGINAGQPCSASDRQACDKSATYSMSPAALPDKVLLPERS